MTRQRAITLKRDLIYKTGNASQRRHMRTEPRPQQHAQTFGEVRRYGFRVMRPDGQTGKQA